MKIYNFNDFQVSWTLKQENFKTKKKALKASKKDNFWSELDVVELENVC